MSKEVWKKIPGYDFYEVSNFGNVRSFMTPGRISGVLRKDFRILKRSKTGGYAQVCLLSYVKGKRYNRRRVARLVWETFRGKIPANKVIDHIDGNPYDDRLTNLRIASSSQNAANVRPRFWKKYKGVEKTPQNNYRARIKVNGKSLSGGRFASEKEAALAYDKLAKLHFGKYAKLNFLNV